MIPPAPADHRSQTGARRSDRTRTRLIEAAVLVIARRGVGPALIEEVTQAAGVSRGTFYYHFPATSELLAAAEHMLAEELTRLVAVRLAAIPDPAEACATGITLFLATARDYPLLAQFSAHVSVAKSGPLEIVEEIGTALLDRGVRAGRFIEMPRSLAVGLIASIAVLSLQRQAEGHPFDIAETVSSMLRMLGIPPAEAAALAHRPPVPLVIPPDSLIARSHNVLRAEVMVGP